MNFVRDRLNWSNFDNWPLRTRCFAAIPREMIGSSATVRRSPSNEMFYTTKSFRIWSVILSSFRCPDTCSCSSIMSDSLVGTNWTFGPSSSASLRAPTSLHVTDCSKTWPL